MEGIKQLVEWVNQSENIVFFGGAGVSTESGIPDFRSATGLYNNLGAEDILSSWYFASHPEEFFAFYFEYLVYPDAKPNVVHQTLADLERSGKLSAVITQNIDGLHQMAGSKKVLELHGSIVRNTCLKCGKTYTLADMLPFKTRDSKIPTCDCGGIIKPDVTLYGEALKEAVLYESAKRIAEADMLIVGGTSLVVNPAAALVRYYGGDKFVIVNRGRTPYDRVCNLRLDAGLGETFEKLF